MYSGNCHYDDMLIPLITIVTFENLQKYKERIIFLMTKQLSFQPEEVKLK